MTEVWKERNMYKVVQIKFSIYRANVEANVLEKVKRKGLLLWRVLYW